MEDLLQSQIRESCNLALPVGLKELMSDISREVLRSQPENLYQFIANYLEALLNARDALSIACRLCGEVTNCSCQPQLDVELSRIGLSQEDVNKAKNIILNHFDKGQVQESNLLIKLATKTDVNETQLVKMQEAIQKAFRRHILKRKDLQVSFAKFRDDSAESTEEFSIPSVSTQSSVSDFYKPTYFLDGLRTAQDSMEVKQLGSSTSYRPYYASVSATTLAGSFVNLPKMIPYSVHNSACDNILFKSERSVMKLLKSIIFSEDRQYRAIQEHDENIDTFSSLDSTDTQNTQSEEINDNLRSIFSQDINVISKNSTESQWHGIFRAIQENLHESSSGGS